MERTGIGVCAVARALGKSHVTVSKWGSGGYRPSEAERSKLERFTSGAVPADLWLTDEERAEIAAVVPALPPVAA